jgi:DNA repair protein RadC
MIVPLDLEDKIIVRTASDLYPIMRKILMRETKIERELEHVWVVSLSVIHRIRVVELVSLGSLDQALLTPQQVFRIPLIKGAKSIILVHNHGGENLEPSGGDLDNTNLMIQVGQNQNIQVLDHLIINEKEFFSFERHGLMEQLQKSKKYVPQYILEKEAQKIGMKIGEKKGLRKGKKEGKREGKKEKAIYTAEKMLKDGLPIETISKYTGLKKHEIEKLIKTPAPKPKNEHNPQKTPNRTGTKPKKISQNK